MNHEIYIIFSFDDTSEYNIKLCDLLDKYNLKGTFYLDTGRSKKLFDIATYLSERNEIGSHTVSHKDLTKLSLEEIRFELQESKKTLERILERSITSFAYPYGRYNNFIVQEVKKAGYASARTTKHFNIKFDRDPYRLSVSLSAYPHAYRDIHKIIKRLKLWKLLIKPWLIKKWRILAEFIINEILDRGSGVFHCLVHADFIEKRNEYSEFEDLLCLVSSLSNRTRNVTVSEYINLLNKRTLRK